jgi:predicted phage tail protein
MSTATIQVEQSSATLEELLTAREQNSRQIVAEIERTLKDSFAEATAALDAEEDVLAREHEQLSVSASEMERLLPARARVSEYEAAQLTLAGQDIEAAAKLQEAAAAANAPAAMRARQREIADRCEVIGLERETRAKQVWRTWLNSTPDLIRPAERFLFIQLLDRIKQLSLDFENTTGATVFASQNELNSLTAPERSEEWISGRRWYKGRG